MRERDSRAQFDGAVDRFARAGIASALLMSPVAMSAAIGVPRPILIAYLIVATPLLIAVIFRRPRSRRR
jgi:hypothetical protein